MDALNVFMFFSIEEYEDRFILKMKSCYLDLLLFVASYRKKSFSSYFSVVYFSMK